MSNARMKRVEKAQMRVLFTVPFFAPGVAKLPVVFDDAVDTACTDGKEIRWGPKFFDSLTDQQVVTVLCHEVSHCMLGHLWRAPGAVDWDTWNQATDHAVNLMLKEFSELTTAKRLADPFPFPDPQDAYLADPQFKGMPEEQIYGFLSARKLPGGGGSGSGQGSGASGKSGGSQGKGASGKTPPKPSQGPSPGGNQPQKGSMPSFGQMKQPAQGPSQQQQNKQLKTDWDATLIQSCQIAKGRGELPGGMERFVDALVKPQVDPYELVKSWLREQANDDWDFYQTSMEYEGSGFMLPSLKSEKMGPVVFATDTSGSIDGEMLRRFQGLKQFCLEELRPSKLVDIYCDARIQKVAEYRQGDEIGLDAPGGGGTAFQPVIDYVLEMPVRPKCVVYLTDLYGDSPQDPDIPWVWCVWGDATKAPFGDVVKLQ